LEGKKTAPGTKWTVDLLYHCLRLLFRVDRKATLKQLAQRMPPGGGKQAAELVTVASSKQLAEAQGASF
jgi:hypothetical protein